MDFFTATYFVAIIVETAIRAPLNKKRRQEKMTERRLRTASISNGSSPRSGTDLRYSMILSWVSP